MIVTNRYKNGWISERLDNRYSSPVFTGTVFKNGQTLFKSSISSRAIKIWITRQG